MANSAEEALAELKQACTSNNAVYATLKVQYTGAWRDDINQISTMVGVPVQTLLALNPWLTQNNFVANDHDYITIKLTSGSPGIGGGSNNQNQVAGFYSTSAWFHPLGVGTWYCTTEFSSKHTGIDLTTGTAGQIRGTPIYAVKAGTVVQSYLNQGGVDADGKEHLGFGYTVLIRHDDTTDSTGNCYYTRYAHMESAGPAVGTKVSQGDQVGTVGNTGYGSTGYHLHFQIYWTSATRTDYTAFNGHASFGVNPNSISDFPGIPYHTHAYSSVQVQKSSYVTDEDVEILKGAAAGNGSVTQSQFDETVNGIADRIIAGKGVDKNSDIANIIREYIKAQFDGIKGAGIQSVQDLVNGASFEATLDKFCQTVVDNTIYFVENKINELVQYAIDKGREHAQAEVESAKTQLKNWIWNTTKIDEKGELAQSVGAYLDSYIDYVVDNGWAAVRTAITTGDIKGAAQNFVTLVTRQGIDYVCELGAHAAANAVTSYIGSHFQASDNSQVVADLAVGIINVTAQSVGLLLKGDISIEQAAKNILLQAVTSITSFVVEKYIVPVVQKWTINAVTTIIASIAGEQIAATVMGQLAGPIGYVAGLGIAWLAKKAWNWLFG